MSCYENTLTACELADLREVVEETFAETCVIQTMAYTTRDGYGGTTPTVASSTTVACNVTANQSASAGEPAGYQNRRTYSFSVPYSTIVGEKDRVVYSGKTLEVESVAQPSSQQIIKSFVAQEVAR